MFRQVNKGAKLTLDELLEYIGEFLYNDYLSLGVYSEQSTADINDLYYKLLFGVQPTAVTSPVYWSKEIPHIHQEGNIHRLIDNLPEASTTWLRKLLASLHIKLVTCYSKPELDIIKQHLGELLSNMNTEDGPYGDTYEVGGLDYSSPAEVLNKHNWLFLLMLISLSTNNFIRIFKEKLNACPDFTTYRLQ